MTLEEYKKEIRDIARSSRGRSTYDLMDHPKPQICSNVDKAEESVLTITFVLKDEGLKRVTEKALGELTNGEYMELITYSQRKLGELEIN